MTSGGCWSASRPRPRRFAPKRRFVFERFEFRKAAFTDLEIVINRLTSPPTATVTFRAIGSGRDRKGEIPYQGFAEFVTVELRLEGDRWLCFRLQARKPGTAVMPNGHVRPC